MLRGGGMHCTSKKTAMLTNIGHKNSFTVVKRALFYRFLKIKIVFSDSKIKKFGTENCVLCNFKKYLFQNLLLQRLEPATPRPSSNAQPTRSGAAPCASPRSGSATATPIASTAPTKTARSFPTAASLRKSAGKISSSARTEDASTRSVFYLKPAK